MSIQGLNHLELSSNDISKDDAWLPLQQQPSENLLPDSPSTVDLSTVSETDSECEARELIKFKDSPTHRISKLSLMLENRGKTPCLPNEWKDFLPELPETLFIGGNTTSNTNSVSDSEIESANYLDDNNVSDNISPATIETAIVPTDKPSKIHLTGTRYFKRLLSLGSKLKELNSNKSCFTASPSSTWLIINTIKSFANWMSTNICGFDSNLRDYLHLQSIYKDIKMPADLYRCKKRLDSQLREIANETRYRENKSLFGIAICGTVISIECLNCSSPDNSLITLAELDLLEPEHSTGNAIAIASVISMAAQEYIQWNPSTTFPFNGASIANRKQIFVSSS